MAMLGQSIKAETNPTFAFALTARGSSFYTQGRDGGVAPMHGQYMTSPRPVKGSHPSKLAML